MAYVLKNQRGVDARHLIALGKRGERQLTQVFGVANDDLQQKIVFTRHVEGLVDFWETQRVSPEGLDRDASMSSQLNGDEGLESDAESLGLHLGVKPAKCSGGM